MNTAPKRIFHDNETGASFSMDHLLVSCTWNPCVLRCVGDMTKQVAENLYKHFTHPESPQQAFQRLTKHHVQQIHSRAFVLSFLSEYVDIDMKQSIIIYEILQCLERLDWQLREVQDGCAAGFGVTALPDSAESYDGGRGIGTSLQCVTLLLERKVVIPPKEVEREEEEKRTEMLCRETYGKNFAETKLREWSTRCTLTARSNINGGGAAKEKMQVLMQYLRALEMQDLPLHYVDDEGRSMLHWVVDWSNEIAMSSISHHESNAIIASSATSSSSSSFISTCIQFLLEAGISPLMCDSHRDTPLSLAVERSGVALATFQKVAEQQTKRLLSVASSTIGGAPSLPSLRHQVFETIPGKSFQCQFSATQPNKLFTLEKNGVYLWDLELQRVQPIYELKTAWSSHAHEPGGHSNNNTDDIHHEEEGKVSVEGTLPQHCSALRFVVIPFSPFTHGTTVNDVILLSNGLLIGIDYTKFDAGITIVQTKAKFDVFGGESRGYTCHVHWVGGAEARPVQRQDEKVMAAASEGYVSAKQREKTLALEKQKASLRVAKSDYLQQLAKEIQELELVDSNVATQSIKLPPSSPYSSEKVAAVHEDPQAFAKRLLLYPHGPLEHYDHTTSVMSKLERSNDLPTDPSSWSNRMKSDGNMDGEYVPAGIVCLTQNNWVLILHLAKNQLNCHATAPLPYRVEAFGRALDKAVDWVKADQQIPAGEKKSENTKANNILKEYLIYDKKAESGVSFCGTYALPAGECVSAVTSSTSAIWISLSDQQVVRYQWTDRQFTLIPMQSQEKEAKKNSTSNTKNKSEALESRPQPLAGKDLPSSSCVTEVNNVEFVTWSGKNICVAAHFPAEQEARKKYQRAQAMGDFNTCLESVTKIEDTLQDSEVTFTCISPRDKAAIFFSRRGELCRVDLERRSVYALFALELSPAERVARVASGDGDSTIAAGSQMLSFNADGSLFMRYSPLYRSAVVVTTQQIDERIRKEKRSLVVNNALICGPGIPMSVRHSVPRERLTGYLREMTSLGASQQARIDHSYFVIEAIKNNKSTYFSNTRDGDGRMAAHVVASVAEHDDIDHDLLSVYWKSVLLQDGASLFHYDYRFFDDEVSYLHDPAQPVVDYSTLPKHRPIQSLCQSCTAMDAVTEYRGTQDQRLLQQVETLDYPTCCSAEDKQERLLLEAVGTPQFGHGNRMYFSRQRNIYCAVPCTKNEKNNGKFSKLVEFLIAPLRKSGQDFDFAVVPGCSNSMIPENEDIIFVGDGTILHLIFPNDDDKSKNLPPKVVSVTASQSFLADSRMHAFGERNIIVTGLERSIAEGATDDFGEKNQSPFDEKECEEHIKHRTANRGDFACGFVSFVCKESAAVRTPEKPNVALLTITSPLGASTQEYNSTPDSTYYLTTVPLSEAFFQDYLNSRKEAISEKKNGEQLSSNVNADAEESSECLEEDLLLRGILSAVEYGLLLGHSQSFVAEQGCQSLATHLGPRSCAVVIVSCQPDDVHFTVQPRSLAEQQHHEKEMFWSSLMKLCINQKAVLPNTLLRTQCRLHFDTAASAEDVDGPMDQFVLALGSTALVLVTLSLHYFAPQGERPYGNAGESDAMKMDTVVSTMEGGYWYLQGYPLAKVDPSEEPMGELVTMTWVSAPDAGAKLIFLREGSLGIYSTRNEKFQLLAKIPITKKETQWMIENQDLPFEDDGANKNVWAGGANQLLVSPDQSLLVRWNTLFQCAEYLPWQQFLMTFSNHLEEKTLAVLPNKEEQVKCGAVSEPIDQIITSSKEERLAEIAALRAKTLPLRTQKLRGFLSRMVSDDMRFPQLLDQLETFLAAIEAGTVPPGQRDASGRTAFHLFSLIVMELSSVQKRRWVGRLLDNGCSPFCCDSTGHSVVESQRIWNLIAPLFPLNTPPRVAPALIHMDRIIQFCWSQCTEGVGYALTETGAVLLLRCFPSCSDPSQENETVDQTKQASVGGVSVQRSVLLPGCKSRQAMVVSSMRPFQPTTARFNYHQFVMAGGSQSTHVIDDWPQDILFFCDGTMAFVADPMRNGRVEYFVDKGISWYIGGPMTSSSFFSSTIGGAWESTMQTGFSIRWKHDLVDDVRQANAEMVGMAVYAVANGTLRVRRFYSPLGVQAIYPRHLPAMLNSAGSSAISQKIAPPFLDIRVPSLRFAIPSIREGLRTYGIQYVSECSCYFVTCSNFASTQESINSGNTSVDADQQYHTVNTPEDTGDPFSVHIFDADSFAPISSSSLSAFSNSVFSGNGASDVLQSVKIEYMESGNGEKENPHRVAAIAGQERDSACALAYDPGAFITPLFQGQIAVAINGAGIHVVSHDAAKGRKLRLEGGHPLVNLSTVPLLKGDQCHEAGSAKMLVRDICVPGVHPFNGDVAAVLDGSLFVYSPSQGTVRCVSTVLASPGEREIQRAVHSVLSQTMDENDMVSVGNQGLGFSQGAHFLSRLCTTSGAFSIYLYEAPNFGQEGEGGHLHRNSKKGKMDIQGRLHSSVDSTNCLFYTVPRRRYVMCLPKDRAHWYLSTLSAASAMESVQYYLSQQSAAWQKAEGFMSTAGGGITSMRAGKREGSMATGSLVKFLHRKKLQLEQLIEAVQIHHTCNRKDFVRAVMSLRHALQTFLLPCLHRHYELLYVAAKSGDVHWTTPDQDGNSVLHHLLIYYLALGLLRHCNRCLSDELSMLREATTAQKSASSSGRSAFLAPTPYFTASELQEFQHHLQLLLQLGASIYTMNMYGENVMLMASLLPSEPQKSSGSNPSLPGIRNIAFSAFGSASAMECRVRRGMVDRSTGINQPALVQSRLIAIHQQDAIITGGGERHPQQSFSRVSESLQILGLLRCHVKKASSVLSSPSAVVYQNSIHSAWQAVVPVQNLSDNDDSIAARQTPCILLQKAEEEKVVQSENDDEKQPVGEKEWLDGRGFKLISLGYHHHQEGLDDDDDDQKPPFALRQFILSPKYVIGLEYDPVKMLTPYTVAIHGNLSPSSSVQRPPVESRSFLQVLVDTKTADKNPVLPAHFTLSFHSEREKAVFAYISSSPDRELTDRFGDFDGGNCLIIKQWHIPVSFLATEGQQAVLSMIADGIRSNTTLHNVVPLPCAQSTISDIQLLSSGMLFLLTFDGKLYSCDCFSPTSANKPTSVGGGVESSGEEEGGNSIASKFRKRFQCIEDFSTTGLKLKVDPQGNVVAVYRCNDNDGDDDEGGENIPGSGIVVLFSSSESKREVGHSSSIEKEVTVGRTSSAAHRVESCLDAKKKKKRSARNVVVPLWRYTSVLEAYLSIQQQSSVSTEERERNGEENETTANSDGVHNTSSSSSSSFASKLQEKLSLSLGEGFPELQKLLSQSLKKNTSALLKLVHVDFHPEENICTMEFFSSEGMSYVVGVNTSCQNNGTLRYVRTPPVISHLTLDTVALDANTVMGKKTAKIYQIMLLNDRVMRHFISPSSSHSPVSSNNALVVTSGNQHQQIDICQSAMLLLEQELSVQRQDEGQKREHVCAVVALELWRQPRY